MLFKTSAVVLALLIPMTCAAAGIKQRSFSYSYDVAKSTEGDVFVVCVDCKDDSLSIVPEPVKLALRMSTEEPLAKLEQRKIEETSAAKPATALSGLIATVHFDFDRSLLAKDEEVALDQLSRQIPSDNRVDITGFSCSIGSDVYNNGLSYNRAKSVAAYLMAKGVSIGKIEGKGKCCPVSDHKNLNRRVEVEIR